jgi:hypothetical protein
MNRLRFATAREVFEAFPAARDEIAAVPTDDPPLAFVETLASGMTPEDAVTFCAYMLPRREAVWWACQCVRTLVPSRSEEQEACLQIAEEWVREPEEEHRRAALRLGMDSDKRSPTTWLALAAAWSGGSMSPGEHPVPTQPDLTAKAARGAVLVALAGVPVKDRAAHLRACLESGRRLAGAPALPN